MSFKPFDTDIFVTRPTLPDLDSFTEKLGDIWRSAWLTNNGAQVQELERSLAEYLGVANLLALGNGTLALMLALKALGKSGSVVTTPFTFPATVNVLDWLGLTPIFADVDPDTGNIDPGSVSRRIQPDTVAVLAVHVFGTPCDNASLSKICAEHGIHLIYDAAHAFGVESEGESILNWGHASTLSFHATKLYSTIEGGAVICSDEALARSIRELRNFGILDEEHVSLPGINAKLNEIQAAYGLLRLQSIDEEIANRARVAVAYDAILRDLPGIKTMPGAGSNLNGLGASRQNHSYYPIRVSADAFGLSRDELKDKLDGYRVRTRKYFYPLCSRTPVFAELESAAPEKLPAAHRLEQEVLCLPIYGELPVETAETIAMIIASLQQSAR